MVNRIWQHLFGEGLVRTTSNFGRLGDKPSHPELLDYLAVRFVENGWSVKQLIREMMLTAAYQRSSFASPELLKADPANQLVGRMNRKRLTYEAIRDSMLFVSGQLAHPEVPAEGASLRTMFEPVERARGNAMMAMFDGPDPKGIIPERADTTTAPQALFLLNNPLVLQAADRLAREVNGMPALETDEARLDYLYRKLLGRPVAAAEVSLAQDYVKQASWSIFIQVLLCTNEFMYVD
jgi:hypothetical protein